MSGYFKKPVLSVVASALGSNYDGAANYCCPVPFGGAARFGWLVVAREGAVAVAVKLGW